MLNEIFSHLASASGTHGQVLARAGQHEPPYIGNYLRQCSSLPTVSPRHEPRSMVNIFFFQSKCAI